MEWLYLFVAGMLEIGWVVGLKYTDGFTRLWPSVFTVIGMIASVFFLALAAQKIPLSTAYASWTGIGAVGTAIFGIALFGEPVAGPRLFFIAIIVASILGLKISSGH
jgi:quaternary ammonium compound-resistance protein SugE